jgi:hypothetical protein
MDRPRHRWAEMRAAGRSMMRLLQGAAGMRCALALQCVPPTSGPLVGLCTRNHKPMNTSGITKGMPRPCCSNNSTF